MTDLVNWKRKDILEYFQRTKAKEKKVQLPKIDRKVYMVFDTSRNVLEKRLFNTFGGVSQSISRRRVYDRSSGKFSANTDLKVVEVTLANPEIITKPIPPALRRWCEENGYELKKKGI